MQVSYTLYIQKQTIIQKAMFGQGRIKSSEVMCIKISNVSNVHSKSHLYPKLFERSTTHIKSCAEDCICVCLSANQIPEVPKHLEYFEVAVAPLSVEPPNPVFSMGMFCWSWAGHTH